MNPKMDVYLESGKKRTFASALNWPGWSRSGASEESALQNLLAYAPRYALILRDTDLDFQTPGDVNGFHIIERLPGGASIDFGVPEVIPPFDALSVDEPELERLKIVLQACWQAFDQAVQQAAGKKLRTGPRGGGRDVKKMVQHVFNAEASYLSKLGRKYKQGEINPEEDREPFRQAVLEALAASTYGELPTQGPRGGKIWPARYFARRSAWHVLDHAWEIEDRITE